MKAIKFLFTNGILAIPLMFWFDIPYYKSFLTGALIGLLSLTIEFTLSLFLDLIKKGLPSSIL